MVTIILRGFYINCACFFVVLIVSAILKNERKRLLVEDVHNRKKIETKYKKVIDLIITILDYILVVFIVIQLIYHIIILFLPQTFFKVLSIIFIVSIICFLLYETFDIFSNLTSTIRVIGLTFYFIGLIFGFILPINETDIEKEFTIHIVEMEETPYTHISGSMYYIKSSPSMAYYYTIATDNGGTTTKVIDGYSNYVEKFQDDKYLENPHIEVHQLIRKAEFIFLSPREILESSKYYIYIPKDSVYYEQ